MTRRYPPILAALVVAAGAHAQQTAPAVSSTLLVTGTRAGEPSVAGPLTDALEAPAQVEVIPEALLRAPGVHRLSDALAGSTSLAENYPAIGYYENFSIRGFTLDRGSAYRINGFVVPGEFHAALDNKERIEVLKGIGMLAAGVGSAGGLVNLVTQPPADAASVRVGLGQRGGLHVALDHGRGASEGVPGFRVTLAGERMRPDASGAEGTRSLLGVALLALPTGSFRLAADLEVQRRSQFAVPGVQLWGGEVLPPVVPEININDEPWSRPVENEGVFAALRTDVAFTPATRLTLGAAYARARIDDNLAFPFGCADPPYEYFCRDGSYVLYDYHAREVRDSRHLQATLVAMVGERVRHRLALGVEAIARRVVQRDLSSTPALAAPEPIDRPTTHADQAGLFVGDRVSLGEWEILASLRRARLSQRPGGGTDARWLPGAALVKVLGPATRLHGSYTSTLEFGSEAPLTAENAGALLAPRRSSAHEIGIKHASAGSHLNAALFRMRRPHEHAAANGNSFAGLGAYRRAGDQVHLGLELEAGLSLAPSLRVAGSATYLRARARATGEPAIDAVQLQNIPRLRSRVEARHAAGNVEVFAAWTRTGSRNARRDGSVSVPRYDRIDGGASVAMTGTATIALRITNLTDRRYWRDASEAYSADLLFPGARREAWLGLTWRSS